MFRSIKKKIDQLSENPKLAPLMQFIKFGLVGVSNTALNYAVDMLCYYVLLASLPISEEVKIVLASGVAFIAGTVNSFFWNSRYVFIQNSTTTRAQRLWVFAKTVICYGVTGLLLAPALKVLLKNWGIPFWGASLCSLVVTIPINFLLNKFWAFSGKKKA